MEQYLSLELLTPEQVESTSFPDADRGYDRTHVDAFVLEIARQLRYLAEQFAALDERSAAPYMRVGREMAELLDHGRKVGEGITARAREEAATMTKAAEARVHKLMEIEGVLRKRISLMNQRYERQREFLEPKTRS